MNKFFIAAAGAGKTTLIVRNAIKENNKKAIIITYTIDSAAEIRKKFYAELGYIPKNVTVLTWFSFLLEHGVKPYQSYLTDKRINGMLLVNCQSGIKFRNGNKVFYYSEGDVDHHYFDPNYKIYSDKISKFVYKINAKSCGAIISRLENIFNSVYIDEVQDLSGYDLEFLKLLLKSSISVTLAGDPRQTIYHTHNERKNAKYKYGGIVDYIKKQCNKDIIIDDKTLCNSYRCNNDICQLSNQLFPNMKPSYSVADYIRDEHDGIFFVKEEYLDYYLSVYDPIQLRDTKSTKVNDNYRTFNFGHSKGLTFERVLIYPTSDMKKWLTNRQQNLNDKTRCKLYVALTRAIRSVAFVIKDGDNIVASDLKSYIPQSLSLESPFFEGDEQ